MSEIIGKRIKQLRMERGMTQQDLAQKTGYTHKSSIGKIETGHVDLSQSKIKLFAEALHVSISDIIGPAYDEIDEDQQEQEPEQQLDEQDIIMMRSYGQLTDDQKAAVRSVV